MREITRKRSAGDRSTRDGKKHAEARKRRRTIVRLTLVGFLELDMGVQSEVSNLFRMLRGARQCGTLMNLGEEGRFVQ
jgi:hypothetical protein